MASADAELQQGLALHRVGQLEAAAACYRRAIARQPAHLQALQMLAIAEGALGRPGQALELFDKALRLAPADAGLQFNRGLMLLQLQRPDEALAAFDAVLEKDPRHPKAGAMRAGALIQKGTAAYGAGDLAAALSCFEQAAALTPGVADVWVNLGTVLIQLARHAEALAALQRALALQPAAADAHFNQGLALVGLRRMDEAVDAFGEALRLQPGFALAWRQRGVALAACGRHEEAVADLRQAVQLAPGDVETLEALAHTRLDLGDVTGAIEAYEQLLARVPPHEDVLDAWLQARMRICDWRGLDAGRARLERRVREGGAVSPTRLFPITDSAQLQLACATRYARRHFPALAQAPAARSGPRIRVGWFSSDWFEHATAFLLAKVLETHDRDRFDYVAFSFGKPPQDAMHRRLRAAFSEFHDVDRLGDSEIAQLARDLHIDIAVDLKGLTQHGRPGIFAHRAAPLQVSFLGYPATMGASCFDYLLADAVVVPPALRPHYAEKILALPHAYQPNDDCRPVDPAPTRAQLGLPESAFVFCSFNHPYKITPEVFDVWMRLLARVPGSVLWLFEGSALASQNLRREAAARGIDPSRLHFAEPLAHPAHLARHACADLFLDTFPCNAHTTASDALWAGLPLVTCAGEAFASRVATSLLAGVGLPELGTASLAEYESLALALALDRERLRGIRDRLARQRSTHPLFDSARYTRDLERAFVTIHARALAHLAPDHVDVPAG